MYQPVLGRFQSLDPVSPNGVDLLDDNNWFGDRLTRMKNLYGYADNNPVNQTDPSGLTCVGVNPGQGAVGAPAGNGVPRAVANLTARAGIWQTEMDLDISTSCLASYSHSIGEACSKIMDTTCLGTSTSPGARGYVDQMRAFCDGRSRLNVVCPNELGTFASRYCRFQSGFCAFSIPHGNTIYICPRMTRPGCNASCIILHELVHMVGDPFETGPESCEEACFPGCRPSRNPKDCRGHWVDPPIPYRCESGGAW
jgi:RHS repeat-associated protein